MDRCDCGATIVQPTTGRRRKRCETCSPTRPRPERRAPTLHPAAEQPAPAPVTKPAPAPLRIVAPAPAPPAPAPPDPDQVDEDAEQRPPRMGRVEAATWAELQRGKRLDTSAGVEALLLASLLDAGGYQAAGAASLAKARREALAVALDGAEVEADEVDELRRAREEKARAAQ